MAAATEIKKACVAGSGIMDQAIPTRSQARNAACNHGSLEVRDNKRLPDSNNPVIEAGRIK